MSTAIPPLSDSEKLEFGENSNHRPPASRGNKFVIASYNIRYARGPYLISGGLRRKMGLMNLARRPQHVGRLISAAAKAFTDGRLLPPVDVLALQEADKRTARTGGHHVAQELAAEMEMHWVHAPAGIPRGVAPAHALVRSRQASLHSATIAGLLRRDAGRRSKAGRRTCGGRCGRRSLGAAALHGTAPDLAARGFTREAADRARRLLRG